MNECFFGAAEPMLEARRGWTITSAHFGERARQYRFAAALTDSPRDVESFSNLAMMFQRLARDLKRIEVAKATVHGNGTRRIVITAGDCGSRPVRMSIVSKEPMIPFAPSTNDSGGCDVNPL